MTIRYRIAKMWQIINKPIYKFYKNKKNFNKN